MTDEISLGGGVYFRWGSQSIPNVIIIYFKDREGKVEKEIFLDKEQRNKLLEELLK